MLARRAEVIPVECVVRGYLTGSGLKQYRAEGQVCGVALPGGLDESSRLPAPIFTPTTKAAAGHDLPLTFEETVDLVGRGLAERLREISIALYERGRRSPQNAGSSSPTRSSSSGSPTAS